MRIALQIDQLGFRAPGGIGTYVRELLASIPLAEPDATVTAFHAPFVRPPSPPVDEAGVVALRTPIRLLYPSWNLLGLPPLPRNLADRSVVHVTNPAGVAPVRRTQALVVTIHDLAFEHEPDAFRARWLRLYRAGMRATARRAHAILVPSRSAADDLTARAGVAPERVHVTPLAAREPTPESPDELERLAALGVRPPYVLFVGTIERRKNLVRLVRSHRRLVSEGLPHSLVLNGSPGWGADAVEREIAMDGGSVVRTAGVDAPTLDALYRHADAFAYPSLYEGFGLPVLEAMRHGVPVVASATSSIPEVAGDAALLVDPTDEDALTAALRRALTDEAIRADLRARGPLRAAGFSWEATARATLAAYRIAEASIR